MIKGRDMGKRSKYYIVIPAILILLCASGCKNSKEEKKETPKTGEASTTITKGATSTQGPRALQSEPIKLSISGTKEEPAKAPEKAVQEAAAPLLAGPTASIPATIIPPEPTVLKSPKEKEEPQMVPFVPSVLDSKTNINVIIDASGSQSALFSGTALTKLDVQKKALSDIALTLIQTEYPRNLGIRTFGSQKPLASKDCSDSLQIYPVSNPDLDQIQKVLSGLLAQGESPISLAIEDSLKDFPAAVNVDQVIVLITDGSDTCGGDLCKTAKSIYEKSPTTTIHVIGFDITKEDEELLRCVSQNANGKFYLARNENELRESLDEAVNSKIPYNLKLSTTVGATPIPTEVTIFKSPSSTVIKKESSFGTKLIKLDPGTYDIMVEYIESPSNKKPSKIIKGVEILENTRIEQVINFEFGILTLTSVGAGGKLSDAKYEILKNGSNEVIGTTETSGETKNIFLAPGSYDVIAEQQKGVPENLRLQESNITVKEGEPTELSFLFQEGILFLKGTTTQEIPIPFIFQIYKAGQTEAVFASGAFGYDGGNISISPGTYDLLLIGQDPSISANPSSKLNGVPVKAAQTTEAAAKFEMGLLKLSAVDAAGKPTLAEFEVRTIPDKELVAKAKMPDANTAVSLPVPPGTYNILAIRPSATEPKPKVWLPDVAVTTTETIEKTVSFVFGTLKLRGRNAKDQTLVTQFAIYRGGTEEIVAQSKATSDWVAFELNPGTYDIRADQLTTTGEIKESSWLKDIEVKDGQQIGQEAIFTTGKLKIIGRGANNTIIKSKFKVFRYSSDRELITGDTGDDWQVFEIEPGDYYIEASCTDPEESVLLKKWINVEIGENETVELVLNF